MAADRNPSLDPPLFFTASGSDRSNPSEYNPPKVERLSSPTDMPSLLAQAASVHPVELGDSHLLDIKTVNDSPFSLGTSPQTYKPGVAQPLLERDPRRLEAPKKMSELLGMKVNISAEVIRQKAISVAENAQKEAVRIQNELDLLEVAKQQNRDDPHAINQKLSILSEQLVGHAQKISEAGQMLKTAYQSGSTEFYNFENEMETAFPDAAEFLDPLLHPIKQRLFASLAIARDALTAAEEMVDELQGQADELAEPKQAKNRFRRLIQGVGNLTDPIRHPVEFNEEWKEIGQGAKDTAMGVAATTPVGRMLTRILRASDPTFGFRHMIGGLGRLWDVAAFTFKRTDKISLAERFTRSYKVYAAIKGHEAASLSLRQAEQALKEATEGLAELGGMDPSKKKTADQLNFQADALFQQAVRNASPQDLERIYQAINQELVKDKLALLAASPPRPAQPMDFPMLMNYLSQATPGNDPLQDTLKGFGKFASVRDKAIKSQQSDEKDLTSEQTLALVRYYDANRAYQEAVFLTLQAESEKKDALEQSNKVPFP